MFRAWYLFGKDPGLLAIMGKALSSGSREGPWIYRLEGRGFFFEQSGRREQQGRCEGGRKGFPEARGLRLETEEGMLEIPAQRAKASSEGEIPAPKGKDELEG